MKKVLRIISVTFVAVLIVFIGAFYFLMGPIVFHAPEENNLPKFIRADFIDLSQIYSISKFRSGAGHDFSSVGETCRSMKHYFTPQKTIESMNYEHEHNNLPKPPTKDEFIPIYSPADGEISAVGEEQTPIGKQIEIHPSNAPEFKIRLFHIYLDEGFGWGSKVKAGEKIGEIGKYQGTDIAVQIRTPKGEVFYSYFEVMPDNIFDNYKKRGIVSKEDVIISREQRDANPLKCNGEQFVRERNQASYNSDDYFFLSGFKMPEFNTSR